MTPAQLASICHWGERKPACHVALTKCGFVEKLSPKGFTAHDWSQHNAKLLANWENGKLGGRPAKPNEINENEKPVGSVGITQPEPIDGQDRTDQTDSIKGTGQDNLGLGSSVQIGDGSSPGSVQSVLTNAAGLVRQITNSTCLKGGEPTLEEVQAVMNAHCSGSGKYADKWLNAMKARGWQDNNKQAVIRWKPLAEAFASGCIRQDLSIHKRPDRNAGTFNSGKPTDGIKAKVR